MNRNAGSMISHGRMCVSPCGLGGLCHGADSWIIHLNSPCGWLGWGEQCCCLQSHRGTRCRELSLDTDRDCGAKTQESSPEVFHLSADVCGHFIFSVTYLVVISSAVSST